MTIPLHNLTKICLVGTGLFHTAKRADGRTDRHDEAHGPFSKLSNVTSSLNIGKSTETCRKDNENNCKLVKAYVRTMLKAFYTELWYEFNASETNFYCKDDRKEKTVFAVYLKMSNTSGER